MLQKHDCFCKESCECLPLRGRPPGYLFSGRKWWRGSFVLRGESGIIQPKQSLVKSPSFLLSFQKILCDEEFWSPWGLSWSCGSWAPWRWKIFYPGGLCKLGCIPFRLESQKVSQPAVTCPVTHCCLFCCWIPVQQWSVGHSVPKHRDGMSVSWCGPFPLGSPWALRVLTFCCAKGFFLEMPTLGGVFWRPVVPLMLLITDLANLKVAFVHSSSSPSLLFKIILHCNSHLQGLILNYLRMGISTFPLKKPKKQKKQTLLLKPVKLMLRCHFPQS